ncbi:MAG: AAA family ATPase [Candidatus Heimdallarchaeota archaeon]
MSSQLFDMAKHNAQTATQLDKAGRSREAVPYYIQAAEQLQQHYNFTDDPHMKKLCYEKAMEYIFRVKEIKGISEGGGVRAEQRKDSKDGDEAPDELDEAIAGAIIREAPDVKWEDVANLEIAKRALREAVILPMKRPELFQGARRPWKGILLFGPPGCGKSYLAKAVASEVEATFFSVSAATLVSKWLGESEKLVSKLFDMARKEAPSIIFIDEVDSVASARGEGENQAMRRVKTQMLQSIEGVGTGSERVVVMGATNLPWDIDAAMRRRFEKRIHVALPDDEARGVMFTIHTKGVDLESDTDFSELAKFTAGYSGADISLMCREALMSPIRELDSEGALESNIMPRNVSRKDFLTALETVKPSVAPKELSRFVEWENQFGS